MTIHYEIWCLTSWVVVCILVVNVRKMSHLLARNENSFEKLSTAKYDHRQWWWRCLWTSFDTICSNKFTSPLSTLTNGRYCRKNDVKKCLFNDPWQQCDMSQVFEPRTLSLWWLGLSVFRCLRQFDNSRNRFELHKVNVIWQFSIFWWSRNILPRNQ